MRTESELEGEREEECRSLQGFLGWEGRVGKERDSEWFSGRSKPRHSIQPETIRYGRKKVPKPYKAMGSVEKGSAISVEDTCQPAPAAPELFGKQKNLN